MIKKLKTGKIKLPVFEYSWSKEIKTEEPNMEIIKNQIDSFIFVINNQDKFKINDLKGEFISFINIMLRFGHITKLNKEYHEKFLIVSKFIKEANDS